MNYNINNETSKEELTKILTPYSILKGKKPKVLVICRGKTHNLVFHGSLMVDYKIENKPDIVMDIWSDSMDDYFPEKSFDVIRIEPCALINKNDPKWIQKKGKLLTFPFLWAILDSNQCPSRLISRDDLNHF